jgi:hypothetical protein
MSAYLNGLNNLAFYTLVQEGFSHMEGTFFSMFETRQCGFTTGFTRSFYLTSGTQGLIPSLCAPPYIKCVTDTGING